MDDRRVESTSALRVAVIGEVFQQDRAQTAQLNVGWGSFISTAEDSLELKACVSIDTTQTDHKHKNTVV